MTPAADGAAAIYAIHDAAEVPASPIGSPCCIANTAGEPAPRLAVGMLWLDRSPRSRAP